MTPWSAMPRLRASGRSSATHDRASPPRARSCIERKNWIACSMPSPTPASSSSSSARNAGSRDAAVRTMSNDRSRLASAAVRGLATSWAITLGWRTSSARAYGSGERGRLVVGAWSTRPMQRSAGSGSSSSWLVSAWASRPAGGRRLVHEAHAETSQLEDDPLPAEALDTIGRRCGRLLPHGRHAPWPALVQPAADPAAALNDWSAPAMERAVEVESRVSVFRSRRARLYRDHFRARGHFPQGDDPSLERHTRLAQDLAPALGAWIRNRPGLHQTDEPFT